jgi:hypothetical protein
VREFVMRNDGTREHLQGCAGMLVGEIDAGRGAMVRSLCAQLLARSGGHAESPHRALQRRWRSASAARCAPGSGRAALLRERCRRTPRVRSRQRARRSS